MKYFVIVLVLAALFISYFLLAKDSHGYQVPYIFLQRKTYSSLEKYMIGRGYRCISNFCYNKDFRDEYDFGLLTIEWLDRLKEMYGDVILSKAYDIHGNELPDWMIGVWVLENKEIV